jgi:uncharacterized membrane protein
MEKLKAYIPILTSRWWTGVLALSIMANLIVGGALIGRKFRHSPFEDAVQNSFVQMVPRNFMEALPHERRGELMDFLRQNRKDMRSIRQDIEAKAQLFANALDAENYDAAAVKTLIEDFTIGNQSMAARGSSVVVSLIAKLTPEERKQLATAIRQRGKRR